MKEVKVLVKNLPKPQDRRVNMMNINLVEVMELYIK